MIRPNPASSAKRRHGGGGQEKLVVADSTGGNVDTSFAALVGRAVNDDVTHGGMYDDGVQIGNSDPTSKASKLFEELLGDDASAIGSVSKGGDASTAMSSVLGPTTKQNVAGKGNANELANIPEERRAMREYFSNISSSNNCMLKPQNIHHQQQQQQHQQQRHQQQQRDEDENEEDTYMTKPREITFDKNADDVSALFGGIGGGASVQAGGVESYMGTRAAPRRNRQRGGGGMSMFGDTWGNKNSRRRYQDEDSRRTRTSSTLHSYTVNSILEEIGLRPSKGSMKASLNSEDSGGDDKGHHGRRARGGGPRTGGRRRGVSDSSNVKEDTVEILEHIRNIKSKTWITLVVTVMFVSIQFTTVRRRDRAAVDYLNQRFQNHRFGRVDAHYSSGTSVGIGNIPIEDFEGGFGRGNMVGVGRRRGAYTSNSLNGEHIGDVLRDTVPLVQQQNKGGERKQEQIMFDDDVVHDGDNNPNLRGGHMPPESNSNILTEMQQQPQQQSSQQQQRQQQQMQQQMQQQKMGEQQQVHQQQLLFQQQQPQHQQLVQQQQQLHQLPKQNKMIMNLNNVQPQQQIQNLGETHPLLNPNQKGLSMADALSKLVPESDQLSDIDPRPQQSLTNDIIPSRFGVFADLKSPYEVGRDTPFFWHIPRSGGVVVKTMLSHCLGQTLATEVGELDGHHNDTELKVISFAEHNYTNVNIATPEGIARALNMGLVPSHLSHTLVSAHVDLVPSLFNANDRARAFVIFRHPVDRAASMFYFLKGTGYPPLRNMSVDDYAKSELIENNWLVRILSESMTGPIDMDNLDIAKEVLRRKFIVGLLDNKRGSFARFDHYFKWKESPSYEKEFGCRKQLMDEKYTPKHPIRKDSDTWKLLLEQNRFDVHLYDFAKELFSQQSYIFGL